MRWRLPTWSGACQHEAAPTNMRWRLPTWGGAFEHFALSMFPVPVTSAMPFCTAPADTILNFGPSCRTNTLQARRGLLLEDEDESERSKYNIECMPGSGIRYLASMDALHHRRCFAFYVSTKNVYQVKKRLEGPECSLVALSDCEVRAVPLTDQLIACSEY